MNIIIGGGTGLVGQTLVAKLLHNGHKVIVVGRNKDKIRRCFQHSVTAVLWNELHQINADDCSAIVNLTGENITAHRWSQRIKEKLLSSRLEATQNFLNWAKNAKSNKPHLYNASAIGIYGLQKIMPGQEHAFTERSSTTEAAQTSFASQLVNQWEEAALQGTHVGVPVTLMRFGVVLKQGDGALKQLERAAQYGMGATIGTGEQPLAWIDHLDLIKGIMFLLANPEITGPINLVAPQLVSQKEFNQTLTKVLNKPSFLRIPSWFIRLTLGQMGEELLLSGQAVVPKKLLEYQFSFEHPTLLSALTHEFAKPS